MDVVGKVHTYDANKVVVRVGGQTTRRERE